MQFQQYFSAYKQVSSLFLPFSFLRISFQPLVFSQHFGFRFLSKMLIQLFLYLRGKDFCLFSSPPTPFFFFAKSASLFTLQSHYNLFSYFIRISKTLLAHTYFPLFHFSIYIILQPSKLEQKLEANVVIKEQMLENSSRFLAFEDHFLFPLFFFFVISNVFNLQRQFLSWSTDSFCSRGYIII